MFILVGYPILYALLDKNSPNIYRLTHEKCYIYDDYDKNVYSLFHNPYGLWRLTESNL